MSDEVACPVCGEMLRDLWDYDWGTRECISTECGWCEADIVITQHVSVRYSAAIDTPRKERTP